MGVRGRVSGAQLTAPITNLIDKVERQRAPHDLNDEETEIWAAVVNAHSADWFSPSTVPILTQYCRHVIHGRRVAELLEHATSDPNLPVSDYDRLLKMQERESRAIVSLATKMRLTQQSTTNHRGNKRTISLEKPWEENEG